MRIAEVPFCVGSLLPGIRRCTTSANEPLTLWQMVVMPHSHPVTRRDGSMIATFSRFTSSCLCF
jgi:hypothetical protein